MRVCSLASVKNRIVLGEPLPFSVRDAGRMLLLARGQVIADDAQLDELFQRGALVEVEELARAMQQPVRSKRRTQRSAAELPAAWEQAGGDVRRALGTRPDQLAAAVRSSTDLLMSLIDSSPNVALAQVVRQPDGGGGHYGVDHSIHAATACHAAARYLGWDVAAQRRAFQAALTMNLGMLDLQAKLATQVSPLTALQREQIHQHPIRSAEMLAEAGIEDADWLEAVIQHHEVPGGAGYPRKLSDVGELAEILRYADVYTARLSARANRPAMSAQQAGRELHQMAETSPLAAAVIKAFGIFPPGSVVRLASGELGLVVGVGDKAHQPRVAALTNAAGEPRLSPQLRDSARDDYAIVALLPAQALPMRLSEEQVAALVGSP
ncbi:HD-GYP domain-containing protein (c-di-GMP phosphodiesterase class II) [Roseateles asaccharophilus]|uniref:HD-GYP domain-containing protein (C-di-GMP phosphodiesterase class II) n=1 Tax=Roseateles asaccharophilus TaxID=582607 RepID=A0A4V3CKA4_9BURK|nr:HD-GYP domain-containing protein (c-di-GMP phosphodiesterase class II) [Roseateles asaccharophilus]